MALRIPESGLTTMLKNGYQHQQGLEEAVFRNIQATKELTEITRTSLGPNGRNKMVVNHLEKLFVTSDAATIMRELEVIHPAAKLLVTASQQQEVEMGDSTNFVVVLAGRLLQEAEYLLRMGLHCAEVIEGFRIALKKALQVLPELAVVSLEEITAKTLRPVVLSAIAAKQYGYEELLTDLVIKAAMETMPNTPRNFNVDSIRIVKILGASIHESQVVRGMVFGRSPESTLQRANDAKVAVFMSGIDIALTETKGTVLIKNADDMLAFSKGEEENLEKAIKELHDAGVRVVVAGSAVGDLAMHFLNRFEMVVVKVLSKFDIRRLCRVTGATPLTRFGVPTPEEMGFCKVVEAVEIGSDRCTVFRQEDDATKTATIVLRGGTQNMLDDLQRAIDDGVNVIKAVCKDRRLVSGAGAFEIELSGRLQKIAEATPGLNQYAINKFAAALEVIPRTLAENAGLDSTEVIATMHAAHAKGSNTMGVDIESENNGILDAAAKGIYDVFSIKEFAIQQATNVALTILSVDQIIMSKPAGGPKVPQNKNNWDEDD